MIAISSISLFVQVFIIFKGKLISLVQANVYRPEDSVRVTPQWSHFTVLLSQANTCRLEQCGLKNKISKCLISIIH